MAAIEVYGSKTATKPQEPKIMMQTTKRKKNNLFN